MPLGFGPDGIKDTADDSTLPEGEFAERFEYDDLGRQTLHVSFEDVHTRFVYDDTQFGGGRLASKEFFADATAYDNGDGTPGETISYTYDGLGRMVQTVHDRGAAGVDHFTTEYDDHGRVIREESPAGAVNYEYDPATGLRTRVFTGPGYWGDYASDQANPVSDIAYEYDVAGRLAKVIARRRDTLEVDSDPLKNGEQPDETVYHYDTAGNLDRTDLPNGAISDYVYDPLNRLEVLTHYAPDATPENLADNPQIAQFSYTVRADGKREDATETFWLDSDSNGTPEAHTSTYDWVYDNLGRLTSEAIDHFDDTFDRTESFIYDLAGNRVRREIENTGDSAADEIFASGFDANDRLLWETFDPDGEGPQGVATTTTYGYDHTQQAEKIVWQGTDTSETTGSKQTRTSFAYNDQGRLRQVLTEQFTAGTVSARTQVSYEYDPQGIRITTLEETDADADGTYETRHETRFLVDHHNHTGYAQTIEETVTDLELGYTLSKTVYTIGHDQITQTKFTHDPENDPVAGPTHTFLHDGHGSVRALLDAAAAIAQAYTYAAYGELLAIHNAQAALVGTTAASALTAYLYSGEFFNSTINQQYLRVRWYNPATGTFNRLAAVQE